MICDLEAYLIVQKSIWKNTIKYVSIFHCSLQAHFCPFQLLLKAAGNCYPYLLLICQFFPKLLPIDQSTDPQDVFHPSSDMNQLHVSHQTWTNFLDFLGGNDHNFHDSDPPSWIRGMWDGASGCTFYACIHISFCIQTNHMLDMVVDEWICICPLNWYPMVRTYRCLF